MRPFDLSQYMHNVSLASGAGLMGYAAGNSYAAGTVGAALQGYVLRAGDTMTGALTVPGLTSTSTVKASTDITATGALYFGGQLNEFYQYATDNVYLRLGWGGPNNCNFNFKAGAGGVPTLDAPAGPLAFSVNGVETMRFNTTGQLVTNGKYIISGTVTGNAGTIVMAADTAINANGGAGLVLLG